MLRVFRGAAPLLAALALAGPAAADSPADHALPLPCVMPPRPPTTAVVPSGLPVLSPIASVPPRNPVMAAPARPTLHPLTTAGPVAHSWPAAFLTCKGPAAPAPETKQAVYVETPAEPADTAAPVVPADDDSAAVADLRERVHNLYGGGTAKIAVEKQPDGALLVRVRVHAADGDADKAGKAVEVPQPGGPSVRVLLEVER